VKETSATTFYSFFVAIGKSSSSSCSTSIPLLLYFSLNVTMTRYPSITRLSSMQPCSHTTTWRTCSNHGPLLFN